MYPLDILGNGRKVQNKGPKQNVGHFMEHNHPHNSGVFVCVCVSWVRSRGIKEHFYMME